MCIWRAHRVVLPTDTKSEAVVLAERSGAQRNCRCQRLETALPAWHIVVLHREVRPYATSSQPVKDRPYAQRRCGTAQAMMRLVARHSFDELFEIVGHVMLPGMWRYDEGGRRSQRIHNNTRLTRLPAKRVVWRAAGPPRSFLFSRCRPHSWPTPAKKSDFGGGFASPEPLPRKSG